MAQSFIRESFEFLEALEQNNDRAWFEPRKAEFRRLLVEPLANVLVVASRRLDTGPWPLAGSERTIFRQLRDQRYAKAVPYATAVRALLTSTGTKPTREGCVHVEVSARGGFVGAGFHRPPAWLMEPIRLRMLDEPDRWQAIVAGLDAVGLPLAEDRLTRMPRGFTAMAHREVAADVRLRSLEVTAPITSDDWLSGAAVDVVVRTARAAMPLLRFGNSVQP